MFKVIARSFVIGQCDVELQELTHSYNVMYGLQNTEYMDMKSALNGYNQCVLHQETCAGWHEFEEVDLDE